MVLASYYTSMYALAFVINQILVHMWFARDQFELYDAGSFDAVPDTGRLNFIPWIYYWLAFNRRHTAPIEVYPLFRMQCTACSLFSWRFHTRIPILYAYIFIYIAREHDRPLNEYHQSLGDTHPFDQSNYVLILILVVEMYFNQTNCLNFCFDLFVSRWVLQFAKNVNGWERRRRRGWRH